MQKTNYYYYFFLLFIKKSPKTHNKPYTRTTKNFFTWITTKNGIQIQNFNTQIQNKAQQLEQDDQHQPSEPHTQYLQIRYPQTMIIYSTMKVQNNVSEFFFFCGLQTKSKVDIRSNQIRERKNRRRPRLDWRERIQRPKANRRESLIGLFTKSKKL